MRLSEAIGEAAFLTERGFLTEQSIQQLRRGDRLVLGVFDLGIERRGEPTVAVVHEAAFADRAAIAQCLLERIEHEVRSC